MGNMLKELKAFLFRGNVLDLAVAVVIGAAFTKIVTSLVTDIITPIIGAIFGQPSFADVTLGALKIGSFIDNVINFVLVGTVLFFIVKAAEKAMPKPKEEAAPAGPSQEELLAEIRDLLKSK